jgi:hypothetical protein
MPLNENDDVRAMTRSCGSCASRFSTSSASPSEKYSWSLAWLMSTNDSTAIDCSEGAAAAGALVSAGNGADAAKGLAGSRSNVSISRRHPPDGDHS